MKQAPKEFADLFNRSGRTWLRTVKPSPQFADDSLETPYAAFRGKIDPTVATGLYQLLEKNVKPHLKRYEEHLLVPRRYAMQEDAPGGSQRMWLGYLSGVDEDWSKDKEDPDEKPYILPPEVHEHTGLRLMMRSPSLLEFLHKVTGYDVAFDDPALQVNGYAPGDHISTHCDCYEEAYLDVHISLPNKYVDSHYLVYEQHGQMTGMINGNSLGAIAVYRLPFWHMTTPMAGNDKAFRFLLLTNVGISAKSKQGRMRTRYGYDVARDRLTTAKEV